MSNRWKRFIGFTVVAVLVSVVGVGPTTGCRLTPERARGSRNVAPVEANWSVRYEEHVLARVAEISGLPQDVVQKSVVRLVTVEEDNTPFLSERIIGRRLWQVTTPKWRLRLPSAAPKDDDQYERTFVVLVDPVDGSLLKIASLWPKDVPGEPPEVPVRSAEAQMRNAERYHGFPSADPAVTFLCAVDIVRRQGWGDPLVAKQIVGHYVMQSRMGGQPTAVWAITLLGINIEVPAPQPLTGESLPNPAVSRMRNIVDADTGEWLQAINVPNLQLVGQIAGDDDGRDASGPASPDERPVHPIPGEEDLGNQSGMLDLTSPSDGLVIAPTYPR